MGHTVGGHNGSRVIKSLIMPLAGSSTGSWMFTHTHGDLFSPSKRTRVELQGKHLNSYGTLKEL